MLGGPFCRKSIQRAFRVVFLVGDHASDARNQIVEPFGSCPEVTDAYTGIVEVGMEDWSQHPALWCPPGVAERKVYFEHVHIPFENLAARSYIHSPDGISEAINFRRHACRAADLNKRPLIKALHQIFVVVFESANSRRNHKVTAPSHADFVPLQRVRLTLTLRPESTTAVAARTTVRAG